MRWEKAIRCFRGTGAARHLLCKSYLRLTCISLILQLIYVFFSCSFCSLRQTASTRPACAETFVSREAVPEEPTARLHTRRMSWRSERACKYSLKDSRCTWFQIENNLSNHPSLHLLLDNKKCYTYVILEPTCPTIVGVILCYVTAKWNSISWSIHTYK